MPTFENIKNSTFFYYIKTEKLKLLFDEKVEFNFIKWTRQIVLIFTYILILTFLILLFSSIVDFINTPNDHKSTPHVTYSQLRESLQEDFDSQYMENEADSISTEMKEKIIKKAKEELEIEKEFDTYFKDIKNDLNEYAKLIGGNPVSNREKKLREVLLWHTKDSGFDWLEELADFSNELKKDADRISKLSNNDVRKINWEQSIEWFINEHNVQIKKEEERVEKEKKDYIENKAEANQNLLIAGFIFVAILFFIVILVLIKIERNTRKD